MNIIFFGTSELAVNPLIALAKSRHKILLVVTQPDRKKGRYLKLGASFVKEAALNNNLEIFQPQDPNADDSIKTLKEKKANLFVLVSYGHILSKELLEVPVIYSINLHPSLLPKYRGAAPVNWALINGEKTTGVCIIKMTEFTDAGPVILKQETAIDEDDDAITLSDKLSKIGSGLLLDAIDLIGQERGNFITQEEGRVLLAPKLKKEDGLIDWSQPTIKIHNKVRGLVPWPTAYTYLDNKLLKIWKTKPGWQATEKKGPGEILDLREDEGIIAQTGDGAVILKEVQLEGSKRMPASAFLHGHRVKIGDVLGK